MLDFVTNLNYVIETFSTEIIDLSKITSGLYYVVAYKNKVCYSKIISIIK